MGIRAHPRYPRWKKAESRKQKIHSGGWGAVYPRPSALSAVFQFLSAVRPDLGEPRRLSECLPPILAHQGWGPWIGRIPDVPESVGDPENNSDRRRQNRAAGPEPTVPRPRRDRSGTARTSCHSSAFRLVYPCSRRYEMETNPSRASLTPHLLSEAERPHIGPHGLDMIEALGRATAAALSPNHARRLPATLTLNRRRRSTGG